MATGDKRFGTFFKQTACLHTLRFHQAAAQKGKLLIFQALVF